MSAGAIAVILLSALAQTPAEPYAWPLDLPRELTSSFGEYRPGRFHMGIDLRTGPIGKNVYAAADGYVSRLRCSPYGYGKAVYIQFDDGNSAVYAHLDDFAPALRDYVRAAQHAREEYTADLTVPRDTFRVKRGELIAKSGQTGIGVPHLHYELRDPAGVPINPRLLGVTWPDKTPPVIYTVSVVPLTPESIVLGHVRPTMLMELHNDAGHLTSTTRIPVDGPVGFSVDTWDPAASGSRLGVHRVSASIGEREIFTVRNDRLSYDHAENGAAVFTPIFERDQLMDLFRAPGNDAEPYRVTSGDGAFVLDGPEAEVLITAEDFAGNRSSVTVHLKRDPGEPLPPYDQGESNTASSTIRFAGRFLYAAVQFTGPEKETPFLVIDGPQPVRLPMRRHNETQFAAAWLPQGPLADVHVHIEHPRVARQERRFVFVHRDAPAQHFEFGALRVDTLPGSPYGVLGFEVTETAEKPGGELVATGPVFSLAMDHLAVDAPITLSLPSPAGDAASRAQFYRMGKTKWERIDTTSDRGRASAPVKRLGRYALFDDTTPPKLAALRPNAEDKPSRRPVIRIRATDEGSGIDTFRGTYNGKWILLAYDPEQDLLEWEQDEDLPAGEGTLVVEVRDHAGNIARAERTITVPGA